GRIPSGEVNDEQDRQFYAVGDEQGEFARSELRRHLGDLPETPCPEEVLRSAAARLRDRPAAPGHPGTVLCACTGFGADGIPESDEELWLTVAAGLVAPATGLPGEADAARFIDGELSREDSILASLCAIQYTDWLAAVVALVRRGPGVLA